MSKIQDPSQAELLAHAITEDILLSNGAEVELSRKQGSFSPALAQALAEGQRLFASRVSDELRSVFDRVAAGELKIVGGERNTRDALKERIRDALSKERWDEAVALLKERAETTQRPEKAVEWLMKASGLLEFRLGDLAGAAEVLQRALAMGHSSEQLLDRLIKLLKKTGDWNALAQVITRRVEVSETEAERIDFLSQLAEVYQRLGDHESAAAVESMIQERMAARSPAAVPAAPAPSARTAAPAPPAQDVQVVEQLPPEAAFAQLCEAIREGKADVTAAVDTLWAGGEAMMARAAVNVSDYKLGPVLRPALLSLAQHALPALLPLLDDSLKAYHVERLLAEMDHETLQALAGMLGPQTSPRVLEKCLAVLERAQVTGIRDQIAPLLEHESFGVKMKAKQLMARQQ